MTVTVFGAYGFLGRYVVSELAKVGTRVYLPFRGDELEVRHLKPGFDLGQVAMMPFSPRNEDSIRAAVANSDVVINLIGKHYDTKHLVPTRRADGNLSRINYTIDASNAEVVERVARISKEAGVKRYIHVSAMSADENGASQWARSKAKGEKLVREAFPGAIIVRPSTCFGTEDRFLNWYGNAASTLGIMPLLDGGKALVQPVHSNDVGKALYTLCRAPDVEGKTYTLFGKEDYTQREVAEFVADITTLHPRLVNLPVSIARKIGKAVGFFPYPVITEDEVIHAATDIVPPSPEQLEAENIGTLHDLGIEPTSMERAAFSYLHRFRPGGHFTIVSGYY